MSSFFLADSLQILFFELPKKLGQSLRKLLSTNTTAAAYLVLTRFCTKLLWQFATLADLTACFLDSWLPNNMSYGQLRAHRRPQKHVDLAPAEPTTLYGARMELGLWNCLREHWIAVREFKQRHLRIAILLEVFIFCFKLELNQTAKISESSMKQNYWSLLSSNYLFYAGQVKQQELPKGINRVSYSGMLEK